MLFIITKQIEMYALVMVFALIHELGHLLCGIILGFQPQNLRILPMGFAVEFRIKTEDYQHKIGKSNLLTIKKLIITIAGPLTNLIIIVVANLLSWNQNIIYANMIIFLWNMIPVYPLDGGRMVKNIAKIAVGNPIASRITNQISNSFAVIVTVCASIAIYKYQNIAILLGVIVLWGLVALENKRFNTYDKIYKMIDKQRNYI